MDIKDILALAHAGFTADQITKLAELAPAKVAETPAAAPQPAPAPASQPEAPAMDLTQLNAAIAQLTQATKEMQQAAIIGSKQPAKTEGVEDILAAIINPPRKEV